MAQKQSGDPQGTEGAEEAKGGFRPFKVLSACWPETIDHEKHALTALHVSPDEVYTVGNGAMTAQVARRRILKFRVSSPDTMSTVSEIVFIGFEIEIKSLPRLSYQEAGLSSRLHEHGAEQAEIALCGSWMGEQDGRQPVIDERREAKLRRTYRRLTGEPDDRLFLAYVADDHSGRIIKQNAP
ncbi:MAG TPA: hypothetical protein PKA61_03100 [Nitrospira sp.]|nr:hypothetical protein [Nitrospira sp.]